MILRLIRITKAARQDCDRWRIGARRLFERGMVMHAAYRRTSETHRLPFGAGADAVLRPVQRVSAGTSAAARNVYGQDRRTNWPMMAVLGVVHAAMLAALVVFDVVPIMQPQKPVVMELIEVPQMVAPPPAAVEEPRSEEHTSELQSLMRISYAVFCLKKKTQHK